MTKPAGERLVRTILRRVKTESAFVEKSGYTLATLERVLRELILKEKP